MSNGWIKIRNAKETYLLPKKCRTCKYSYLETDSTAYCQYILMKGKRRNCDPKNCDKYEARKGKVAVQEAF